MNRAALVVGEGNGLGTTIFTHLADAGMDTAICAADPGTIDPVARDLREAGAVAHAIECDPKDPVALSQGFADAIEVFETVDVVAFVAGFTPAGRLFDVTRSEFLDGLHRDVLGAFCTARGLAPKMGAWGGGTMLFVGGPTGFEEPAGDVRSRSSQGALYGFVGSLAEELGENVASAYVSVDGRLETTAVASGLDLDAVARVCADRILDAEWPQAREYRITSEGRTVHIETVTPVTGRRTGD